MIKPILFSTPMVLAILDGRKTMTRRVVKTDRDGLATAAGLLVEPDNDWCAGKLIKPPYHPGDILWVRETWGVGIQASGGIVFKANFQDKRAPLADGQKWRPSIFMPREAARIWLRVTDVRVERVQDITENDAMAEGCSGVVCEHSNSINGGCSDCMNTGWFEPPELEFMDLWDKLNAKRGYGWHTNPWVWVIGFERCGKPQEVTP